MLSDSQTKTESIKHRKKNKKYFTTNFTYIHYHTCSIFNKKINTNFFFSFTCHGRKSIYNPTKIKYRKKCSIEQHEKDNTDLI